jgi:hypothetical protein
LGSRGSIESIELFNLSPQEKEDLIKDLQAKHGRVPLIHLIRRLIVALDQTQPGTEHRHQTLELLRVLTNQNNIASSSASWLDWLESASNDLTWESIRPAPARHKFDSTRKNADVEKAPPVATTSQRLSVEAAEEPRSKNRPRPLTREQQIWDEALRRSEANKNRMSRQWLIVLFALIVAGLGYLGYQRRHLLDEVVSKITSSQPKVINLNEFVPELLWCSLQPPRNPMEDRELWPFLKETGSLKNLGISSWQEASLGPAQKLMLRLWIQEQTYLEVQPSSSTKPLDLRSFPLGERQWKVERTEADGHMISFVQSETIRYEQQRIDMTVKRACGADGIAHRIILDERGILAWSWRLRVQDQVIDGQVIRQNNPPRLSLKISLPKNLKVSHSVAVDPKMVIFPAVWSPSLRPFQQISILYPISGLISSSKTFEGGLGFKEQSNTLIFDSSQNHWQEVWTPIP